MKFPILVIGCLALVAATAQAAAITINSSTFVASADDRLNNSIDNGFLGTTIPTSTTIDAVDVNAFSKNVINWSVNGGQTILSFDVDHKRNGTFSSTVVTGLQLMDFTANSNETYAISGYYNVTNVGPSGSALLTGALYDITSNAYLFESQQVSAHTTNVQFVAIDFLQLSDQLRRQLLMPDRTFDKF